MTSQNYGATARAIRQSKGLTLAEVADDQLSVASLSKFENGVADLTLSKFVHLLERLWVTPEAFTHRYLQAAGGFSLNGYYSMGAMLVRWFPAGLNFVGTAGETTLGEMQAKFETQGAALPPKAAEAPIAALAQDLLAVMTTFMANLDDGRFAVPQPAATANLRAYLLGLDDWDEFDLYLFIGFAVGLSAAETATLFDLALRRCAKFLNFRSERDLLFRLTENLFTIELARQNLANAGRYLEVYRRYLPQSHNPSHNLAYLFDRGWLALRRGDGEAGERDCQQVLTVTQFLALPELEAEYKELLHFIHTHPGSDDWQRAKIYID